VGISMGNLATCEHFIGLIIGLCPPNGGWVIRPPQRNAANVREPFLASPLGRATADHPKGPEPANSRYLTLLSPPRKIRHRMYQGQGRGPRLNPLIPEVSPGGRPSRTDMHDR
jgi:hypothetical protein